jgi:hypothetical protein
MDYNHKINVTIDSTLICIAKFRKPRHKQTRHDIRKHNARD